MVYTCVVLTRFGEGRGLCSLVACGRADPWKSPARSTFTTHDPACRSRRTAHVGPRWTLGTSLGNEADTRWCDLGPRLSQDLIRWHGRLTRGLGDAAREGGRGPMTGFLALQKVHRWCHMHASVTGGCPGEGTTEDASPPPSCKWLRRSQHQRRRFNAHFSRLSQATCDDGGDHPPHFRLTIGPSERPLGDRMLAGGA